jgi:hypothetical protein
MQQRRQGYVIHYKENIQQYPTTEERKTLKQFVSIWENQNPLKKCGEPDQLPAPLAVDRQEFGDGLDSEKSGEPERPPAPPAAYSRHVGNEINYEPDQTSKR